MRYFLTLSYRGTHYAGWQIQPGDPSVQETLETALSTIFRQPVGVTGCGRTDAGVHARYYVAHADLPAPLPPSLLYSLNSLLPADIAVHAVLPMPDTAHARFDALERSYVYTITLRKDPFATETAWHLPKGDLLDLDRMQEAAALLLRYQQFFPFCKTHSGVEHYACALTASHWVAMPEEQRLEFHVSANRFLRGMVRLIVGACVQVGQGKLQVADIRRAMDAQAMLKKSWSVPPQGLALNGVKYPYSLGSDQAQLGA